METPTLHWILRVAVAACFIGHGAFGIITKTAWLPYFAIFGIPEAWASTLCRLYGPGDGVCVHSLQYFSLEGRGPADGEERCRSHCEPAGGVSAR